MHMCSSNIYKTSCAHKWGQYTPTLITTHLIQKYPIKISILQLCATQVGILQEKKWIEPIVFSTSSGNPIFGQIFGHQRGENEARNTKMYRGQETRPIRINAKYEMNWANSFFKKFRKPCLQTNGRTDRRTDRHRGESSIPPFHL